MRVVIQRVSRAQVTSGQSLLGRIEKGLLIFLGVGKGDTHREVTEMVEKIVNLRIFENEEGRFDRSLLDLQGEVLVVSQFTLYADCRKGRRPSFTEAASPQEALPLYHKFIEELSCRGLHVEAGSFGERMQVELVNEGPVTICLEISPGCKEGGVK
ncbi:MAG: D-aminoacyl-tRNA deacylase [bacterium]